MKYVIDIPQSYYEQIQEYPQRIWIGRDIIKPLQTELEEIKGEFRKENYYNFYSHSFMIGHKAFEILDKHISELKGENK